MLIQPNLLVILSLRGFSANVCLKFLDNLGLLIAGPPLVGLSKSIMSFFSILVHGGGFHFYGGASTSTVSWIGRLPRIRMH